MALYIIGDLHLSFGTDKPMNIFGGNWENHTEKLKEDWLNKVNQEDTVILAGDFSWATYLKDTYNDFCYIKDLPGKKILLKGNHDYWWTTVTSMRNYLTDNGFKNIDFLYNNSYEIENKIIVGTRGWALNDTDNSEKMINREVSRLELSIKDAQEKYGKDKEIICVIHYPPLTKSCMKNKFTELMKKYSIKRCFYAHLHGNSHNEAVEGIIDDIEYKLISGDYLDFKLVKILDK